MRFNIGLILFLAVGLSSFGQVKYNSDEHFDFEQCGFVEEQNDPANCYINVLDYILLRDLNANIESLQLHENGSFNLSVNVMLNAAGTFELVNSKCNNTNALNLVTQTILSIEPVLPREDKNGQPTSFSFFLFKNYFINEEGTLSSGIPKSGLAVLDEVDEDVAFNIIENVPVYPGCTGTNLELKTCMSQKIQKHVQKKFNLKLASTLDLDEGIQRIYALFSIDKEGLIDKVKVRAPHPLLEVETRRVLELIPKMKPGMQRGKVVGVRYSLPIIFKVEGESAAAKRKRLKEERKKARKQ